MFRAVNDKFIKMATQNWMRIITIPSPFIILRVSFTKWLDLIGRREEFYSLSKWIHHFRTRARRARAPGMNHQPQITNSRNADKSDLLATLARRAALPANRDLRPETADLVALCAPPTCVDLSSLPTTPIKCGKLWIRFLIAGRNAECSSLFFGKSVRDIGK